MNITQIKDIVLDALTKYWNKSKTLLVKKTDIVDNLTTESNNLPLSAKQGKVLKEGIDLLNGNFARTIVARDIAGDLFDTTYGKGWYYFADQSINTPETYGICFILKLNGWSVRLAIGMTGFLYTNVNNGSGFGTWRKLQITI